MVSHEGLERMQKHGGGFVKALAECWFKADYRNKKKLENCFLYFRMYEREARDFGCDDDET